MIAELAGLRNALVADIVKRATAAYQARDWTLALLLYRHIQDAHPALGTELSCPLLIARCEIELADDAALEAVAVDLKQGDSSTHEAAAVHDMKLRAIELCRDGDHRRASRLLRLIAHFDGPIHRAYADGMLSRRSRCDDFLRTPTDAPPPPFLAKQDVAAWPVTSVREHYRGLRILHVRRYAFFNNVARQNEVQDRITRTATALGFFVHEINTTALPGAATKHYAAYLRQTIAEFLPQLIVYDELFMSGVSAQPEHREEIAAVLEEVRRAGVRVVKAYTDAWYVDRYTPSDLFAGLGRSFDLVQHCHPAILDRGTDAEKAAVFCYPAPHAVTTPTVGAGTVAKAGFVGSATLINIGRLVWWAECARANLPLDFIEGRVQTQDQLSDLDYANLLRSYQVSVNFTQRPTGVRILTGRAIEVPLAGGVLVEEDSADTRYFMTPGVHYVPYETLPDLCAIVPALLADAPRRREIATAAHAWCSTYLTGDYFWAGLLYRLFG